MPNETSCCSILSNCEQEAISFANPAKNLLRSCFVRIQKRFDESFDRVFSRLQAWRKSKRRKRFARFGTDRRKLHPWELLQQLRQIKPRMKIFHRRAARKGHPIRP